MKNIRLKICFERAVMSLTSKLVLWLSCGLSAGTIGYVHFKQWSDKQKLHEGVIKDVERQQKRKVENLYFLQQQLEMSKIMKKEQSLDDAVTLKLLEDSKEKTL